MAKILRLRRGTATQHATFTGLEGEITVDTTNDTIRVHDNVAVGGHILASRTYVDNKVADIAAGNINLGNIDINSNTISTVNTNQNLNLDPNGTGYVNVSGNLIVSPSSNHISVGNMYIGNSATIKNTDTTHGLSLIGGPNFVDDTNNIISVIANTFSYAHTPNNGPALLIGYREPSHFPMPPSTDTVEFQISKNDTSLHIRGYHANNYIHFDHTSQNIGVNTFTPDHTFTVRGDLGVRIGNIYASRIITSDTNQNFQIDPNGSGEVIIHSNLVPGTNSTYNLGSSDYEWNSLFVSNIKINDGVHEKFQTKADATGVVTHDCSSGHIFYHTSADANWTANFTNLNLTAGYATAITLVIAQGGTGYYPSAVQISGSAQTLNWQGNATPTPSTNRTDVVTFSIINNSGTYTVLGQLTGF